MKSKTLKEKLDFIISDEGQNVLYNLTQDEWDKLYLIENEENPSWFCWLNGNNVEFYFKNFGDDDNEDNNFIEIGFVIWKEEINHTYKVLTEN